MHTLVDQLSNYLPCHNMQRNTVYNLQNSFLKTLKSELEFKLPTKMLLITHFLLVCDLVSCNTEVYI